MGRRSIAVPRLLKLNLKVSSVIRLNTFCRYAAISGLFASASLGISFAQQPKSPASATASTKTQTKSAQNSPSVPSLTPVTNPATAAQVRELLDLTGASRNANLMVGRMIDQMKMQAPAFFPQDFWTDMRQSFQNLNAQGLMVPYFQKYYSQPDIARAIAFYKSPAGRRLVAVQPVIMQQTQKIVMQRAQEIGHQVLMRHQKEIEALAKQYQQQRGAPGAPGSTGSGAAPNAAQPGPKH